jgi:diguanylate cyclase (GGDEF)-like protein
MKEHIQKIFNKEEEINKKISELEVILRTTKDPVLRHDSIRALLEELKTELIDTHYNALTDDLTGFLNKKNVEEVFDKIVTEAKKGGICISLILLDIDYLKYYNDNFGHMAGTELITEVAKAISKSIRNSDIAIRYGGDEFMLFCLHNSKEGGRKVVERVRKNISLIKAKKNIKVTISIGCESVCADEITNYEEMFVRADKKLYEAKDHRILPKQYEN